jgi:hypothetical protein
MNTPWFDPSLAWIPGTTLGITAGLFGAIFGILMTLSRQKKRLIGITFIRIAYGLIICSAIAMLVAGCIALSSGQPYGIRYGLGLAGLIGVSVLGSLYSVVFYIPRQIEAEWKTENG